MNVSNALPVASSRTAQAMPFQGMPQDPQKPAFCKEYHHNLFFPAQACIDQTREIHFSAKRTLTTTGSQQLLQKIKPKDRLILEALCQDLLATNLLGYPLWGDKPMTRLTFVDESMATPTTKYPANGKKVCNRISLGNVLQPSFQDWQLFQKYLARLSYQERFIFRELEWDNDSGQKQVILVNRDACFKVVRENIDVFRKVLGNNIAPDDIIRSLESDTPLPAKTLMQNNILLGILLGYGRENAIAFQRWDELIDQVATAEGPELEVPSEDGNIIYLIQKHVAKKGLQPSAGFDSAQEELDWIGHQFDLGKNLRPHYDNPRRLRPNEICNVGFKAFPSQESKNLIEQYSRDAEHIQKIMQKQESLAAILNQLCPPQKKWIA